MAEPATLAVTGSRAGGADPRRSGAGPLRGDGPAHAVQRRDGGGGVRLEGSLRSAGLQVDAWVSTYTAIAAGELATVSDAVPRLTGHPATGLRELLSRSRL